MCVFAVLIQQPLLSKLDDSEKYEMDDPLVVMMTIDGTPRLEGLKKDCQSMIRLFVNNWNWKFVYQTNKNQIVFFDKTKLRREGNKYPNNYKTNWTVDEIDLFVKNVKTIIEIVRPNGLIFIISSHGQSEREILATDGEEYSLYQIYAEFHNNETGCPYLANKPKIFFVDACQGPRRPLPSGLKDTNNSTNTNNNHDKNDNNNDDKHDDKHDDKNDDNNDDSGGVNVGEMTNSNGSDSNPNVLIHSNSNNTSKETASEIVQESKSDNEYESKDSSDANVTVTQVNANNENSNKIDEIDEIFDIEDQKNDRSNDDESKEKAIEKEKDKLSKSTKQKVSKKPKRDIKEINEEMMKKYLESENFCCIYATLDYYASVDGGKNGGYLIRGINSVMGKQNEIVHCELNDVIGKIRSETSRLVKGEPKKSDINYKASNSVVRQIVTHETSISYQLYFGKK